MDYLFVPYGLLTYPLGALPCALCDGTGVHLLSAGPQIPSAPLRDKGLCDDHRYHLRAKAVVTDQELDAWRNMLRENPRVARALHEVGEDGASLLKWFIDRKTPPPGTGQNRLNRQALLKAWGDLAITSATGWTARRAEAALDQLLAAGLLYEQDGAVGVVE